ncbi:MAG: PilZ domain-containing protein [Gammaproteobacteria bacterium]
MTDDIGEQERRRFFRIEDDICLDIASVTEQEYREAPCELSKVQKSAFAVSATFATLNQIHLPMMNSIRASHPEIAQYLDLLNKKLDSLSQHILDEELLCSDKNKQKVNISASGIAFQSKHNYSLNQPLMLRLVLLPEKIGIEVFGRVVNTQTIHDSNDETLISVDFEHIREEDQEILIKHNLNKQMHELRKKSGNN